MFPYRRTVAQTRKASDTVYIMAKIFHICIMLQTVWMTTLTWQETDKSHTNKSYKAVVHMNNSAILTHGTYHKTIMLYSHSHFSCKILDEPIVTIVDRSRYLLL